ncbi:MAG: rhomboid family intramembrane serine protease [Paludibacteraceae bacterium]|nr:rhomboid family intramembrane serine protease [Paludibacteraceae bacterium]
MEKFKAFFEKIWKSGGNDRQLLVMTAVLAALYLLRLFVRIFWPAVDLYTTMPSYTDEWIRYPWTILTYPWVHLNLWHLLGNCLILYGFGRIFLQHLSFKRLLALFFTGTIAGAVCYLALYEFSALISFPLPAARLIGASAGIMAIVCALIPKAGKSTYRIFGKDVPLNWIILVFLAVSLLGTSQNTLGTLAAYLGGGLLGYAWIIVGRKWHIDLLRPAMWLGDMADSVKCYFYEKSGIYTPYEEVKDPEPADNLDEILTKLRQSGYDALSDDEKKKLFEQNGRS